MLGICLARAYEVSLTTRAVRILDATLNSRNVAAFKTGLVRIVFINLGGAILRIAYSYLQARLTWKWCVFTPVITSDQALLDNASLPGATN